MAIWLNKPNGWEFGRMLHSALKFFDQQQVSIFLSVTNKTEKLIRLDLTLNSALPQCIWDGTMSALSTLGYYTVDEVGCDTLEAFLAFSAADFLTSAHFGQVHATSESCWVLWDCVYDITKLLVSFPPHAVKSILSVAGKIFPTFSSGRTVFLIWTCASSRSGPHRIP